MRRPSARAALFILVLCIVNPSGFAQLRNISEYSHDRLCPDQIYFILYDSGKAEFGWAAEWTAETTLAYEGKAAMLIWHFKDGMKAYLLLAEDIGNIGKNMGFSIAAKASNLEDIHRKKIQPLTRNNYPVKVELWIGAAGDETGFSPEILGDAVCFNASTIEQNRSCHFSSCFPTEK
jgi:hypothetical protein